MYVYVNFEFIQNLSKIKWLNFNLKKISFVKKYYKLLRNVCVDDRFVFDERELLLTKDVTFIQLSNDWFIIKRRDLASIDARNSGSTVISLV